MDACWNIISLLDCSGLVKLHMSTCLRNVKDCHHYSQFLDHGVKKVFLSFFLKLQLERPLIVSSIRCVLQLTLMVTIRSHFLCLSYFRGSYGIPNSVQILSKIGVYTQRCFQQGRSAHYQSHCRQVKENFIFFC